ncbi:MAG: hypothetical protein WBA57_05925 [Elainellaceae cyanobacterium]
MSTFEQILDGVADLPLDQQELLIEIVKHRTTAARRQELAKTSQEALAEYRTGQLQPQTSQEAIAELRAYLESTEDE